MITLMLKRRESGAAAAAAALDWLAVMMGLRRRALPDRPCSSLGMLCAACVMRLLRLLWNLE